MLVSWLVHVFSMKRALKARLSDDGHTATAMTRLLDAAAIIREGADIPTKSRAFLPARSKWDKQLRKSDTNEERLWVVAVMFRLQEVFRSNDIWLDHARRYADDRKFLVPLEAAKTMPGLDLPLDLRILIDPAGGSDASGHASGRGHEPHQRQVQQPCAGAKSLHMQAEQRRT